MFLKSHLFYFVLWAKAYGFYLRARAVNSDYILSVLQTVKFVFCLQIHALAECTMNSKFSILHSAPAAEYARSVRLLFLGQIHFSSSKIQQASIALKSMARSCVRHEGGFRFESQLWDFFVMSVLFFPKLSFFKVFFSRFYLFCNTCLVL